jgi:DNA-binding phage protein
MSKEKIKHETAMEHAKEMLDKHKGMSEITDSTGLSEKDVNKARHKLNDRD